MDFSEYAQGISPFCSFGKSEQDFFTELIGNFIKDAAMDSCKILKRKPDTKYRYVKGTRTIQPKDARNTFTIIGPLRSLQIGYGGGWTGSRIRKDNVLKWLNDNGYK